MAAVREYSGTPLYSLFIDLLGAIDLAYADDLRSVTPERLGQVQGGSKQCRLLREQLITDNPSDIPKF